MKYFIICPVRNATEQQKQEMADIITAIEHLGHSVYYPARDTNQEDETGYRICTDNKNAIRDADIVLVYYDKNSSGTLFDLGVAFALDKEIVILNEVEDGHGKSFSRMIQDWESRSIQPIGGWESFKF